ncbi:MAG: RNA polymerase sigma factor [Bacteroidales bacterium]|nr:RNA polymerase sigma factor [Bacteroidales bacterium]
MGTGLLSNSGLSAEAEGKVLERARNGDRTAARELYDRYSGYLAATCSRFLPDQRDQKDVLQESFVKIFTSLDSFDYRGEGSLKAWMRRILVNESLKTLRGKRRSEPVVYEEDFRDVAAEEEVEPPDVENVPAEVIHEMIKGLPDGYRSVFNLYALEGRSHKEIAGLLGISESTSASQLHRARTILARKIKEYIEKVKIKR